MHNSFNFLLVLGSIYYLMQIAGYNCEIVKTFYVLKYELKINTQMKLCKLSNLNNIYWLVNFSFNFKLLIYVACKSHYYSRKD